MSENRYKPTEEHRRKLSEAAKGRLHGPVSEETKKKISQTMKGKRPKFIPAGWNKGKKATDESKKKSSESHKKFFSNGGKHGMKGRHHSKETKEKLSKLYKGRKKGPFSEETKKRMSIAQKKLFRLHPRFGEKAAHWKGGLTEINRKIRQSAEFLFWKQTVLQRDEYVCQMPGCDGTEHYLHAHHIKTFAKYPELRFVVENGITLCRKCHKLTNYKEEKFEQMFIEINKTK